MRLRPAPSAHGTAILAAASTMRSARLKDHDDLRCGERLARRSCGKTVGVACGEVQQTEFACGIEQRVERGVGRLQRLDQGAHVVTDDCSRSTTVVHGFDRLLRGLLRVEASGGMEAPSGGVARVGQILAPCTQLAVRLALRIVHRR
jgi:hypothetical protein